MVGAALDQPDQEAAADASLTQMAIDEAMHQHMEEEFEARRQGVKVAREELKRHLDYLQSLRKQLEAEEERLVRAAGSREPACVRVAAISQVAMETIGHGVAVGDGEDCDGAVDVAGGDRESYDCGGCGGGDGDVG